MEDQSLSAGSTKDRDSLYGHASMNEEGLVNADSKLRSQVMRVLEWGG